MLEIIPLTQPSIDRRLVFIWPQTHLSPAGRAFVELAEHEYDPASKLEYRRPAAQKRLQPHRDGMARISF
jgi:hypothetical protein